MHCRKSLRRPHKAQASHCHSSFFGTARVNYCSAIKSNSSASKAEQSLPFAFWSLKAAYARYIKAVSAQHSTADLLALLSARAATNLIRVLPIGLDGRAGHSTLQDTTASDWATAATRHCSRHSLTVLRFKLLWHLSLLLVFCGTSFSVGQLNRHRAAAIRFHM